MATKRKATKKTPAPENGLTRAKALAKEAKRRYAELREACRSRVVRWAWGDFTMASVEPAWFETNQFTPGRPLPRPPSRPKSGVTGHGYDAEGRLHVIVTQTEFAGRENETFHEYREGGIARFHFDYAPTKDLVNASWIALEDGQVVRMDTVYAAGVHLTQKFSYNDGRLATIAHSGGDEPSFRDIEHDAEGRIRLVGWRYEDGRSVVIYRRAGTGPTLRGARDELRDRLTDCVVAALRRARPDGPVYALALWHCGAEYQHRFPPHVALATEPLLERFRKKHPKELTYYAWFPAEFAVELHPERDLDDETKGLFEAVADSRSKRDPESSKIAPGLPN